MKRYKYYPVSNYLEPIDKMIDLANELGITKATLSAYKLRWKCIGKYTKPIYEWFYIVDDTFSTDELNELSENVCKELNNEVWVPLFDGSYHISNYGRIKSMKGKQPMIMRQVLRRKEPAKELGLKLIVGGVAKMYFTRHLVATAFIEKEDRSHLKSALKEKYVFKKINCLTNNFADNLRWGTVNDMKRFGKNNNLGIPVIKCDPVTNEKLEYYNSQREAGKDNYIAPQAINQSMLYGTSNSCGYKWIVDEEWLVTMRK